MSFVLLNLLNMRTGEVTAGSFQEVLESRRDETPCCLPTARVGKNSRRAEAKHELREGVAASSLETDGGLGAHT